MKFPYGISDFDALITRQFHYVDRTDRIPGTLKNRYFRHPADSNPLIIQAPNLRKLYFSRCPSVAGGGW